MRRSGMILLFSTLLAIVSCGSPSPTITFLPHRPINEIDIQGHQSVSPNNVCGPEHVAIPDENGIVGQECVKMDTINPSVNEPSTRTVITVSWGDGPHDNDGKVEVTGVKGTTVYDDGKSIHE